MTVYSHPMLRRRSRLSVAAWMTALCMAAGDGIAMQAWLHELIDCSLGRSVAADGGSA